MKIRDKTAIQSILLPITIGGSKNLIVASIKSHTVIIQIVATETIVPMISALFHP